MAVSCDDCGRKFETQDGLDVHPCEAQFSKRMVRTVRTLHDPAQRHLDEFDS